MVDSTSGANIIMQMANKPSIALEDPTKMMQDVEDLRGKQLSNKKSALGLNMEQSNGIARAMLAASMDPNATSESMAAEADRLGQLYGVDARIINSWKSQIQPGMTQAQLQQLGLRATSLALTPAEQYDRSTPQTKLVDKGGQLQPVQINPAMGASPNAITEVGQEITKTNPPTRIDNGQTSTPYDSQNRPAGAPVAVGMPTPAKLSQPYNYAGPNGEQLSIPYGEAIRRMQSNEPLPGYPGAQPFAAPANNAPVGAYVPRAGGAAAPPPGPAMAGAVGNVGALGPDGTIQPEGAAAPTGPAANIPTAAGTIAPGAPPPTSAGATQVGPTPIQQANVGNQVSNIKAGGETYQKLMGDVESDSRQMTALRQAFDVSRQTITGTGATAVNARTSQLRTWARAVGIPVTDAMTKQDVASAILNKASANIVNNNPMAGHAVAAMQNIAHGSPSAELPEGALREISLQMMGQLQMRNYLRAIGQSDPGRMLEMQRDAYQKLDPTAFVWDIMDPKEQRNYAGLIAQDKDTAQAAARFAFSYDEMNKAQLRTPGGLTTNQQLPAGQPEPTRQPNAAGNRNRLLGVPSRTGSNPLLSPE